MKEYNFFIRIRYGLTEQLYDKEVSFSMHSTELDEETLVESFREFIKYIRGEHYA